MTNRCQFAVAPVLLCLVGCGGAGDVSGKVTFNGKPVVVGTVVVLGSDSLPYTAPIDESGEYLVPKVPTGPAKIAVVSRKPGGMHPNRKQTPDSRIKAPPGAATAKWFPIPDRYAEPATSGIAHVVRSGANSFDIAIVDKAAK